MFLGRDLGIYYERKRDSKDNRNSRRTLGDILHMDFLYILAGIDMLPLHSVRDKWHLIHMG